MLNADNKDLLDVNLSSDKLLLFQLHIFIWSRNIQITVFFHFFSFVWDCCVQTLFRNTRVAIYKFTLFLNYIENVGNGDFAYILDRG